MSQLSKGIEPNIRAFLEEINSQGGPQLYELSVDDAREVLLKAQDMEIKRLPADIEDYNILGGSNFFTFS
ncbi:MAG: hypothetical protein K8E24_002635 [Methanobacterium paludis]|nr:hypothetical protein [Methanobacterium paludis]